MGTLGTFTVTVNGETFTAPWDRIDLVRYEQRFEKSSAAMDGMTDQYRMAWIALRRQKVAIPEDFEAFLELSPDVDLQVAEDDEGKDSGKTTGASTTG